MHAQLNHVYLRRVALAGMIALLALACADPDPAATAADALTDAAVGDGEVDGPPAPPTTEPPRCRPWR